MLFLKGDKESFKKSARASAGNIHPFRNAVLVMALVMVAALVSTYFQYRHDLERNREEYRIHLSQVAWTTAALIDANAYSSLDKPVQPNTERHMRGVEAITNVLGEDIKLGHVYTMTIFDKKLHFIHEASQYSAGNEEDYIVVDPVPRAKRMFRRLFDSDREEEVLEIYTDQWNKFSTLFAPIRNSNKEMVGFVGISANMYQYERDKKLVLRKALVNFLIASGIALLVGLFVYYINNYQLKILRLAEKNRDRSEEMLERYKLSVDGSNDGIWDWDVERHKVFMSPKFMQLLGYAEDEKIFDYDDVRKTIHRKDFVSIMRSLQKHMHNPKVNFDNEVRLKTRYGDYKWFLCRGKALRDKKDNVQRMGGAITNIHMQKEYEYSLKEAKLMAEKANAAKSVFLANTSHEVRTPLNAIIGFADILSQEFEVPKKTNYGRYKEYVTDIKDSAYHLLEIINDILDLSKAEAGKIDLNIETVSVKKLVRDSFTILKSTAALKKIDLDMDVDANLPAIKADYIRCKQILLNLLSNAVKFTDEGGAVKLTVSLKTVSQRIFCCFEVKDTGIGIKSKDIHRLFTSFEQIDSGLDRKYEGTGLGLALSKRLAHIMGGDIEAKSTFGKGSTFTLILPA